MFREFFIREIHGDTFTCINPVTALFSPACETELFSNLKRDVQTGYFLDGFLVVDTSFVFFMGKFHVGFPVS